MKNNMLKIGLAIQGIAMLVDEETFKTIQPYLKDIEANVLEMYKKQEESNVTV